MSLLFTLLKIVYKQTVNYKSKGSNASFQQKSTKCL